MATGALRAHVMKIRPDEGELAAQIRRLMTQANPSLQRFRGLGDAAPVPKTPASSKASTSKPSTQSSNSPIPTRPGTAQGSGTRLLSSSPRTELGVLLDPVGSLDDALVLPDSRLLPQGPLLPRGSAEPIDRAEASRHAQVPEQPGSSSPGSPGPLRERIPLLPEVGVPEPRLRPRVQLERQAPLDLSTGGELRKAGTSPTRAEPQPNVDRAARGVENTSDLLEPREVPRIDLRAAAENKHGRDLAGAAGEALRPEAGALPPIDPRSAAELQTLIALHARASTPFATALAEIRASSPKTKKTAAKAQRAQAESVRLARKARARNYAVLAALFGLFLFLVIAKSCSGA
jgi:hypothetical protein